MSDEVMIGNGRNESLFQFYIVLKQSVSCDLMTIEFKVYQSLGFLHFVLPR